MSQTADLPIINFDLSLTSYPANTFSSSFTKLDERIEDGVVVLDILAHHNAKGDEEERVYLDIPANRITSNRPFRKYPFKFKSDGVVRGVVGEGPMTSQTRYGFSTGLFYDPSGSPSKLENPFYVQDLEHFHAFINACTASLVSNNYKRLEVLWKYVLDRVDVEESVTPILKRYDGSSQVFPSTFVLSQLGYDGIVCENLYCELLPQAVKFTSITKPYEYSQSEY